MNLDFNKDTTRKSMKKPKEEPEISYQGKRKLSQKIQDETEDFLRNNGSIDFIPEQPTSIIIAREKENFKNRGKLIYNNSHAFTEKAQIKQEERYRNDSKND